MKANQSNTFDEASIQTEMENIYSVLNKVSFGTSANFSERGENIDSYLLQVTAGPSGEDTEVTHDLKRIPIGHIVATQNVSGDFYAGTGTNSDTQYFIKCTTADAEFTVILI